MVQFVEVFPDEKIVAALRRHLGWAHFKSLIPIKDTLKRDFYAEMCRMERWNTRTLPKKIGGMLFERTALSRRPDKLIRQELAALREEDKLTPDLVFRDPYFLDFLGLKDTYAEKDIEAAILREIESFILEPGVGFTTLCGSPGPAWRRARTNHAANEPSPGTATPTAHCPADTTDSCARGSSKFSLSTLPASGRLPWGRRPVLTSSASSSLGLTWPTRVGKG